MPFPVTGAILAGGNATRLGGLDKSALCIRGRAILDRQLAALHGITGSRLIIANDPAFQARVPPEVRVVPDRMPGAGALGGLYTALDAADTPWVLVLACDLPFIRAPFLEGICAIAVREAPDAVVPRTPDGWQPLAAVYATRSAPIVRQRLEAGDLQTNRILDRLRVREVGPIELAALDPDGLTFFNINTPDDYRRAQALAGRAFLE